MSALMVTKIIIIIVRFRNYLHTVFFDIIQLFREQGAVIPARRGEMVLHASVCWKQCQFQHKRDQGLTVDS